jgi:phage terminase large subunit-like protein
VLRDIVRDPLTVVTKGTTYDNLSNLSPLYQSIIRKFKGTRLGRQELNAELLDDVPGALWTYAMLDRTRVWELPPGVSLQRAVVGVDPSATEDGNEAGIFAAAKGSDGRGYGLADRTIKGRPEVWAKAAVDLFEEIGADHIVAEQNNGGQMVESTITAYARSIGISVPVRLVTASRGKITRAEPIALLYENGTISHLGSFPELEDEMCTYQELDVSNKRPSPNRMDAMVWAFTDLFERGTASLKHAFFGSRRLSSAKGPSLND